MSLSDKGLPVSLGDGRNPCVAVTVPLCQRQLADRMGQRLFCELRSTPAAGQRKTQGKGGIAGEFGAARRTGDFEPHPCQNRVRGMVSVKIFWPLGGTAKLV